MLKKIRKMFSEDEDLKGIVAMITLALMGFLTVMLVDMAPLLTLLISVVVGVIVLSIIKE